MVNIYNIGESLLGESYTLEIFNVGSNKRVGYIESSSIKELAKLAVMKREDAGLGFILSEEDDVVSVDKVSEIAAFTAIDEPILELFKTNLNYYSTLSETGTNINLESLTSGFAKKVQNLTLE